MLIPGKRAQLWLVGFIAAHISCQGQSNQEKNQSDSKANLTSHDLANREYGPILLDTAWSDSSGKYLIFFQYKEFQKPNGDIAKYEIRAFEYAMGLNETKPNKRWSIFDFVTGKDSILNYVPNTFGIIALPKMNHKFSRFIYEKYTEGEPRQFKYLAHYQDKKYAIRGEIPIGFNEEDDCEYTVDPALKSLPVEIRELITQDYIQLLKSEYSCFSGK
jgi:hypothetical protein